VVEAVPDTLIRAIGAAPKAGRDRWMKLGELLSSKAAQASAVAEISGADFQSSVSDDRFQLVFNHLSQPEKRQPAEPVLLKDNKGKIFAQLHTDGKKSRIEFAAGIDRGFVDAAMKTLIQQYDAFISAQSSKV
jgi:ParB family chromosome partitioning protein